MKSRWVKGRSGHHAQSAPRGPGQVGASVTRGTGGTSERLKVGFKQQFWDLYSRCVLTWLCLRCDSTLLFVPKSCLFCVRAATMGQSKCFHG